MKDALGDRMKSQYENRTRYLLPRRTYAIIRLDGKAFHTFTRGLKRPYDERLINAMNKTAEALCSEIQGSNFAYTQSDEISLLVTDFKKTSTTAWFDYNIQKIASVSAAIATANFNKEFGGDKTALFDSRVFTIPDRIEVENYFLWRQNDCVRNSISMTAQSLYSSNQLDGKNTSEQQDMCMEKGVNWNDMPAGFKRGRFIIKEFYEKDGGTRSRWAAKPALWITKEREKLTSMIPVIEPSEPATTEI
jgi:tRNA(His) guanylyltransferase